MSGGVVLDAGVALKVVLAEDYSEQAAALVAETVRAHQPVYAPPTLVAEALNALFQRTRSSEPTEAITDDHAARALTDLLALRLDLVAPAELFARTLAFAQTHGFTGTEAALYVVLAQTLGVELWTDDRTLIDTLAGAAPWVRWIGDYPLPPDGVPQ